MARDTRRRILDTALAMFNAQGEPHVTTNHIADELEISPGNLYYHFRNKDDIIEHLFKRYQERMDAAMTLPGARLPGLEDFWLQLHLVFECIWDYRLLYRDLIEIISRSRRLRLRFAHILHQHAGRIARTGAGRCDACHGTRTTRHRHQRTGGGNLLAQLRRRPRREERATGDSPWHRAGDAASFARPSARIWLR